MSRHYTVEQGDCLSSIGERFRIPWKKIWEHTANKELRDRRGNPNILYPGDKVFIPDLEPKNEEKGTDQKHTFKAPGKTELRIRILDLGHQPMSGVKYQYVLDGRPLAEENTDGDGVARCDLPKGGGSVRLKLPWGTFPVEVGHLDPARTIRGIQQRLLNLGIDPGPIDGIYGPLTARGIRSFQDLEDLEVTGRPNPALVKRLREVHDKQTLDGRHNEIEEHAPDENQVKPRGDLAKSDADEWISAPPVVHIEQEEFPVAGFDPVDEP